MKKKPTGVKTYVSIAIVAIIALFLAHPKWLPFSAAQQQSIIQTERDNLIFTRDARTTASQIITLLLALCIIWLIYQILRLILKLIGKRGNRTRTITEMLGGLLKYVAVIIAVVWGLSILGVDTAAVLAGVAVLCLC